MKCDQCEMVSINGHACHETGCPNRNARYDADRGEWIKQYTCGVCGYRADEDKDCCTEDDFDQCGDYDRFDNFDDNGALDHE